VPFGSAEHFDSLSGYLRRGPHRQMQPPSLAGSVERNPPWVLGSLPKKVDGLMSAWPEHKSRFGLIPS